MEIRARRGRGPHEYMTNNTNTNTIFKKKYTFTDRQCELDQRTGSKSPIPVIVPIYLDSTGQIKNV